jgi:hypothetical protein
MKNKTEKKSHAAFSFEDNEHMKVKILGESQIAILRKTSLDGRSFIEVYDMVSKESKKIKYGTST